MSGARGEQTFGLKQPRKILEKLLLALLDEGNLWENTVLRYDVAFEVWHSALSTLRPSISRFQNSKYFSYKLGPFVLFDTGVNEPTY
jgi:hypothetical protein